MFFLFKKIISLELLAKLFHGYHYVLTILAEIHPGFVPILKAHAQIIIEDNSKPWKAPIYKVIPLHNPTRTLYLIGAVHKRIMRSAGMDANCDYCQDILSPKLKEILVASDAFANEHVSGFTSKEYAAAEEQFTLKSKSRTFSDRFNFEILFQVNQIGDLADGLDQSALLYLVRNHKKPLEIHHLETEEMGLQSMATMLANTTRVDLNELFLLLDQEIYSEEEGRLQFNPGMLRTQAASLTTNFETRNPLMVASLHIILEKHLTSTAFVGISHLYGDKGILNLLQQSGSCTVTAVDL